MELGTLSDHDLREMLKAHGVNAGPVTTSTRTVLQKKLFKVISADSETVTQSYSEEKFESRQNNGLVEEVTSSVASEVVGELEDVGQYYNDNVNHGARDELPAYTNDMNEEVDDFSYSSQIDTPSPSNHQDEVIGRISPEPQLLSYNEQIKTPSRTSLRYAPDSYPSSDNLRRRPLSTPRVAVVERVTAAERVSSLSKVEKITKKDDHVVVKPSKWRWLCNRLLLLFIVAVILLVLLVYYHMDNQQEMKTLPPSGKEE